MKVYFVGAGPGDPELMTVKARRIVESCQCCIYAGSLVSDGIIDLIPASAEKHDSAGMSLEQIVAVFKKYGEMGKDAVRLHSGDPSIYGAIGEQMKELDRLNIDYEVVPGVSSFQAAAAALRVELTSPEVSQTITLTRTSGRTPLPEYQELEHIAATRATLCIFLSIHKVEEIAKTLSVHYGWDCPAAVVFHASRKDQKILRGTLADIAGKTAAEGISKTALVMVGPAIGGVDHVSKLYDSSFAHGYRDAE